MSVLKFSVDEKIWVDDEVYLKALNDESFDQFYQLYSDSELMQFVRVPMNFDAAKTSFSKTLIKMKLPDPNLFLYVIESTAGDKMGIGGVKKHGFGKEYEIGVVLFAKFQKINVSTKVKLSLMNWMFSQSKQIQITAYCQAENTAPNHINEKLKFKFCGSDLYLKYKRPMNKWLMTHQQYTKYHK